MSYRHYGSGSPLKGAPPIPPPPPKFRFPVILVSASLFIAFLGGFVLYSNTHSSNDSLTSSVSKMGKSQDALKSSDKLLNFTLKRRSYNVVPYFDLNYDSFLKYEILKKFVAIVEPYQEMEFHDYDGKTSGTVKFSVCNTQGECQEGFVKSDGKDSVSKSVNFKCSPYEEFDISAYELDEKQNVISARTGKALCLYVRREIRSLTKSDLNAFLDASYTLNAVSEEQGKEKYGSTYHDASYLARFHHFNAAQQDQDHIHEGNGFLVQHLKITDMFDTAIRAVDPSQSMPYWEFTIDQKEGKMSWDSLVCDSALYGNVNLPSNVNTGYAYSTDKIVNGKIADGRWANIKAEKNPYPELNYGYGYLRAPWNMNPSPYLSRFPFDFGGSVQFPACSAHYSILQYTDMMDYFYRSAFGPHATTHTVLSGFYGCDKFLSLSKNGYIKSDLDAYAVCSSWSFFIKECWRNNYIIAKKDCVVNDDIDSSKCGYSCNPSTTKNLTSFLFPQMRLWVDSTVEGAEDAWLDFLCDGDAGAVFTGDHLESASAADPSFWVIHPTLERLTHAKLLAGGFETETWATDGTTDYVCNRPRCYNTTTNVMDYYEDCCYGHYENDRLLDAVSGNRFSKVGVTNKEMLVATDPRTESYSMPYVYDSFSWDHCDEDFDGLLTDMYNDMKSGKSRIAITDQKNTKEAKARRLKQIKTL